MKNYLFLLLICLSTVTVWSQNFTVNSNVDAVDVNLGDGLALDGAGNTTLRAAIMESNALGGAHTVTIPAGNYVTALAGGNEDMAVSGDYDIASDITIIGASSYTTIIDGDSLDRVFHVISGNVRFENISIYQGFVIPGNGGGILNEGNLEIFQCMIYDCVAELDFGGTSESGFGGAVANFGTIDINKGTFYNNSAIGGRGTNGLNGGGGGGSTPGLGGGFYNHTGANATIVNSTLSANNARGGRHSNGSVNNGNWNFAGQDGGGLLFGAGGAAAGGTGGIGGLFSGGGGGGSEPFGGGTGGAGGFGAGGGGGGASAGGGNGGVGGVGSHGAGTGGQPCCSYGGGGGAGSGFGGGVFNRGTLNLTNTTIAYNKSYGGAGASGWGGWAWGGSSGASEGGGIYNHDGTMDLNNSIVSNNEVHRDVLDNDLVGTTTSEDLFGTVGSTSGHNLILNNLGTLNGNVTGDIYNTDPGLIALTDNGGTTLTHAIPVCPSGPATNAANDAVAPALDQRDFARVGIADIGAYESENANIDIAVQNTPSCETGAFGEIIVTPNSTAPYSFLWDANAGNETDSIVQDLAPGMYSVTITDGVGCTKDTTIEILSEPSMDAGNDADAYFCAGGTGSDLFDLTGATDQTGTWIGPSALANGYQGSFDPNTSNFGEYQYFIVSTNSCPNDTADIQVQVVSSNVDLGNDTTICEGENLTLDAGAGFDFYLWGNNEITQTIDVNTTGAYSVQVGSLGNNLVINGDFESGDQDFSSDYTLGVGGPWGLLSDPATYAINTSANNVHTNFPVCTDHTSGGGNYMIVNGASTLNTNTWCQTINVQPNTDYQFSTWVNTVSNDPEAILQFSIDGVPLGGLFNAPTTTCDWQQFFSLWNSGANTSITICILNQSTQAGGNDYGLDDISFRPVCADQDIINVDVQALPVVDLGGNQSICETAQVDLDAGNAGMNYLWQDNSTDQVLSTNTAGDYSVVVTDAFNCSSTDEMTLAVETVPNAGQDDSQSMCESSASIDMNGMVDVNGSFGTWEIMSGTPNLDFATGIVQLSGAESFQIANVMAGIECPSDTAFYDVQVEEQPDAGTNNNLKLCNDSILDLSSLLEAGVNGGVWSEITNSNQFNTNSGTFNTVGLSGGIYTFEYEIVAILPCVNDVATLSIEVVEMPEPLFVLDQRIGCVEHTVQFSDLTANAGDFVCNWNFGDNTNSTSCGSISHTYTTPGIYDVTYSIMNDNLCFKEFTINDAVEVIPNPTAFFTFGPSTIFSSEPTVVFTNGSSNATSYTWDFGDGSSTSMDENPVHTYPDLVADIYTVELLAENALGCSDVYSLDVIVVDEIIFYVPNAFTPDEDNYNPEFKPIMTSGFQVDTYNMEVYNRWGELVFISNEVDRGWDGTYKGKLVQDGTYVWKIYFKEQFNDKKHEHIGHVTLIR